MMKLIALLVIALFSRSAIAAELTEEQKAKIRERKGRNEVVDVSDASLDDMRRERREDLAPIEQRLKETDKKIDKIRECVSRTCGQKPARPAKRTAPAPPSATPARAEVAAPQEQTVQQPRSGWGLGIGADAFYGLDNYAGVEAFGKVYTPIGAFLKLSGGYTKLMNDRFRKAGLTEPDRLVASAGVGFRFDVGNIPNLHAVSLDIHGKWMGQLGPHEDNADIMGVGLEYKYSNFLVGIDLDYNWATPTDKTRKGYEPVGFGAVARVGIEFP